MQKLVVGYDGSETSRRALERAAAIGRSGGSVTVVSAVPAGLPGARSMGMVNDDELRAVREGLDAAQAHLRTQGVEAQTIEGSGDPAAVIIDAAKELGADLIVVGTRGLSTAKRLVLGSVSSKVVQDAPCDVLVVR